MPKRVIFEERLRVLCGKELDPDKEEEIYTAIDDKLSDLKLELRNAYPELEIP